MLHVFNVHLGTALIERRHQGRKLIAPELLSDVALEAPRIVLGDFNEWTTGLATRLLRSHMESADIARTCGGRGLIRGCCPSCTWTISITIRRCGWRSSRCAGRRKALVASDHLPLIGDFSGRRARSGAEGEAARGARRCTKRKWFQVT